MHPIVIRFNPYDMNKALICIALSIATVSNVAWSQSITLDDVIQLAHKQSTQSRINSAQLQSSIYSYDIYYRSMLPSISLNATLPNLNRSLDKITLPDGTDEFVQRSQMFANTGLTINQPLIWTGGNITFNPTLQRIDIFGDNPSTSYLGNPVSFGLSQPLFGFNPYKWQRKTEPLTLNMAHEKNVEDQEDVAIQAIQLYYSWLTADMQYELAENFKQHNDSIYQISQGRFDMGKIAENDLLQAELNMLNSDISLQQSEFSRTLARMRLEQFLNEDLQQAEPVIDTTIKPISINYAKALDLARQNMSEYSNYQLQRYGAEREIAQAKSNARPSVGIFASFGLTQSGTNPGDVIVDPQDRQLLVAELDVPLYQFGRNKANTERAKINRDIINDQLELNRIALEQQIFERVTNFILLQDRVDIARKADEVANKSYDVTRNRFMIGKIDMIELNNAVNRKTEARMEYVRTLQNYWMAYYEIRKLCHYDFRTNQPLNSERHE